MVDQKVSYRYATSLMDLALEKSSLEVVSKDITYVEEILNSSSELRRVLANPSIKPEKKFGIITEIFKPNISTDTFNFLHLIVDKGRIDILQPIISKFNELKNAHLNILDVEIQIASNLDQDTRNRIEAKLMEILKKKIKVKYIIDNELIGGFKAKVQNVVYDATVRHQLELLRKQFLQADLSLN